MTTTHWRNAVTGDFAKAGKWDDGRPGIKDDAFIAATGPDYIVKVVGADAAHALTLDSADATLKEKTHGSLHLGVLNIEAGTAVLTTANTIGNIALSGGDLKFSDGAALGDAAIAVSHQATLSATANAEIANSIMVTGATIAVSNDATLKLDGEMTFDTSLAERLNFIGNNANGAADGSGVTDMDGSIGAMSAHTFLLINGATLGSSIAQSGALDTLLTNAQTIDLESNSVLDLTGQNNLILHSFGGTGELVNTGARENVTIFNGSFGGTTTGDFDLTIEGTSIGGTIALKPGDKIQVIGGTDFLKTHFQGDAPPIVLSNSNGGALTFDGDTYSGAGPAVDLGTGHNVNLSIDHGFIGTISNFGGHNGGGDTIILLDATDQTPSLEYQPNADGTGGELIVQYATAPEYDLNLIGSYSQGDFTVNPGDPSHIHCSAEQSALRFPVHEVDALI
ncbi:MAG TPA: hypothetical protein VGG10_13035 [Rhizomicrobium sp.]|jgi:hypothetical protein